MFGVPDLSGYGCFPLPVRPALSYRSGGLAFGVNRGNSVHAGCYLEAPAGTKVFAIYDGTIWYTPGNIPFFVSKGYGGRPGVCENPVEAPTYELALITEFGIIRYGEIAKELPKGVRAGATVSKGQHIASVAHQFGGTMLHLELFSNTTSRAGLTKPGNKTYDHVPAKNYHRRSDLEDPTTMLDWSLLTGG